MATVRQSGGDYSTLQAAIAANETTIDIQGTWTAADTTAVIVDNANTTITADADSRHPGYAPGSPTHYRLHVSGNAFRLQAANILAIGLDIKITGTAGATRPVYVDTNGLAGSELRNCLVTCNSSNDQDCVYLNYNSDPVTLTLTQCMIGDGGRAGVFNDVWDDATIIRINSCTVCNNGTRSASSNKGGFVQRWPGYSNQISIFNSTICGNTSTGGVDVSGDAAPSWNISNSIDGDNSIAARIDAGSGNLASRTLTDSDSPGAGNWVVIEDATAYPSDLRLKSNAENDAQDMHATATAHSLTIPSTDIVGTSRPQNTNYDCGAFEIVSGAPSEPSALPGRARYFANLLNH